MKKVICDTNIWYELGKGKIKFDKTDKYDLYCTYLSLYELIHTERLKTYFDEVSNACKAVLSYSKGIIFETPITHINNLLRPTKSIISKSNFIEAIEYLANIEKLDNDIIPVLDKYLLVKNSTLDNSFVKSICDEIEKARFSIHQNKPFYIQFIKRNEIKQSKLINLREQVVNEIKNKCPLLDIHLFTEIFWQQIDLYMKSRMIYFEKLKLDKIMNVEKNDAIDMINLIYVNDDCLYWTEDTRWKNIIREAKLDKLLFNNEIENNKCSN